jgi:glucan phosphoethanolaminetransferase (alkaline phosphatase superfamily)
VRDVVKIYKLMQLNIVQKELFVFTNESFLAVSSVNAAYVLVLYGTLFYMFWVWARRFYGNARDRSVVPLIGLVLLIAASAAMVIILNGAFGGAILRLRFWPFLSIGVYISSVTSWRVSRKEQAVTT